MKIIKNSYDKGPFIVFAWLNTIPKMSLWKSINKTYIPRIHQFNYVIYINSLLQASPSWTTFLTKTQFHINGGLLGCDSMWTCKWILIFQMNLLPTFSGLKTETVHSPEMLVPTHKSTKCHNHQHPQCWENLKHHPCYFRTGLNP